MYTVRLVNIVNKKRKIMDKLLKPSGYTRIEWQLLCYLYPEKNGLTQKSLNKTLDNDSAFIARALDKLEGKDLIERHTNPQDKRQKQIVLTKQGKSIAKKLHAKSEGVHKMLVRGLSEQELQNLENLIAHIENNIEIYDEENRND